MCFKQADTLTEMGGGAAAVCPVLVNDAVTDAVLVNRVASSTGTGVRAGCT